MVRVNLAAIVYLAVGVVVAADRHYLATLHTFAQFGSAALAIVLWPLLFLGINLHVH